MSQNNGRLEKDTVFNWFSRYENETPSETSSKHFPLQTSTHPVAGTYKQFRVRETDTDTSIAFSWQNTV